MRALTYALQGKDVVAMLQALHGEGHPALWYLLLRGTHALAPIPQVLPALAFIVALAGIWLLVFRSPFSLPVIALLLASYFAAYEYSVMARNYGISMLLMFVIASLYDRWRDRGWLLGPLLFLLANTNTYSVILVGAFLSFWLLDVLSSRSLRRSRELKVFLLNALPAVLGCVLCWLTVHPLINDAAVYRHPGGLAAAQVVKQMVLPAGSFDELLGHPFDYLHAEQFRPAAWNALDAVCSLILFGATLGLLPRPAAFVAANLALVVLSVFFGSVSPGHYRHEALWLVFLVSLYWIEGRSPAPMATMSARIGPYGRRAANWGAVMFVLLLLAQIPDSVRRLAHPGRESRSAELAKLIDGSLPLHDAIIVADPDFLVESLAYFLPNPTYLLRENRFGHIPVFTARARLDLSLAEVLDTARQLRAGSHRPVVILLQRRLKGSQPDAVYPEGFNWRLIATHRMVVDFLANVQRVASLPDAVLGGDESFDVYVLV